MHGIREQVKKMNAILCVLCLFVSGLAIEGIYLIKRDDKLKKYEGKLLLGKKVSAVPLMGTPTRYIVDVQCQINGSCEERKIITTDKNIMKYKDNENISLIYVEKNNKVYWAEEKTIENVVKMVLLATACAFALLLAVIAKV